MNCYILNQDPNRVVFEFNYSIDAIYDEQTSILDDFVFIVFATNKEEDEKLIEKRFIKSIDIEKKPLKSNEKIKMNFLLEDEIEIDKSLYDQKIKLFFGIIKV